MTATTVERRDSASELQTNSDELAELNADYDRLVAVGDEKGMARVSTRIAACEQRRRNIEARVRGEQELRRDAGKREADARRAAAWRETSDMLALSQRWASVLEHTLDEASNAISEIRRIEAELGHAVAPLVAEPRDRELVSQLKPLLFEVGDIEASLKSQAYRGLAQMVQERCTKARTLAARLLSLEETK